MKQLSIANVMKSSIIRFFFGFLLFACVSRSVWAQNEYQYRVTYYDASDGLPSTHMTAIQEDSLGFLWLGTYAGGLVRFDGYSFKSFVPDYGDSTSISGRQIVTLHVDAAGGIWAGGGFTVPAGFSYIDPVTEDFKRYQHHPNKPGSLMDNEVVTITSSPLDPGIIWIGTRDWPSGDASGVSRLDIETGAFTHFTTENGLADNLVKKVLVDSEGTLWVIGWEGGLSRYDPDKNSFRTFFPEVVLPQFIGGALYEDRQGNLWIGSRSGLSRFDRETESFTSYLPLTEVLGDGSNRIRAILEDSQGTLWIGTDGGLFTFDREDERFTRFEHQMGSITQIVGLYEDRFGLIWACGAGGLMKLERWINPFTVYRDEAMIFLDLRVNGPIREDSQGTLWIGAGERLYQVRRDEGTAVSYPLEANVISIYEDQDRMLWSGYTNGIISKMDLRRPGYFTYFRHDPDDPSSINYGSPPPAFEDRAGNLWIPLWGGGIDLLNRETYQFSHYTNASHGLGDERN